MRPQSFRFENFRSFYGPPVELDLDAGFSAFIGVNNSGKSSLLRFFFEARNFFLVLSGLFRSLGDERLHSMLGGARTPNLGRWLLAPGERAAPLVGDGAFRLRLGISPSPNGEADVIWPAAVTVIVERDGRMGLELERSDGTTAQGNSWRPISNARTPGDPSRVIETDSGWRVDLSPVPDMFQWLANAQYIGPFRNAINVGAKADYFDLAVGDAFISQWDQMQTGVNPAHNEAIHALTQELARIFGFGSLQITAAPDGQSMAFLVDGRSYRGTELGAGIAHFLVVAANVMTRRPTILLIDEPELNLHPSLQIDFLSLLASYSDGPVLLATHSVGLARTVADRIYSVVRDAGRPSIVRPWEATPNLGVLLGQLGYSGATDLQFKGVLLVEGVTEVKVFQQWLRRYGKEHEWAILHLGGGALIRGNAALELSEVTRISGKVVAVIDSERSTQDEPLAPDRQAFVEACGRLNIACTVLERRATENYLPGPHVRAVMKRDGLGAYQEPIGWRKADNWRVARLMTREDLDGTDLGEFLDSLGQPAQ